MLLVYIWCINVRLYEIYNNNDVKNDFYRYSGVVTCATCRSISEAEGPLFIVWRRHQSCSKNLLRTLTGHTKTKKTGISTSNNSKLIWKQ